MNRFLPLLLPLMLVVGCKITPPTPDQLALCEGKKPGDRCRAPLCTANMDGYYPPKHCVGYGDKAFCPDRGSVIKCSPVEWCDSEGTELTCKVKTTLTEQEKDEWCGGCVTDILTCMEGCGADKCSSIELRIRHDTICNNTKTPEKWLVFMTTLGCNEGGTSRGHVAQSCSMCGGDDSERIRRLTRDRLNCPDRQGPR
jgi:hypothetical protein